MVQALINAETAHYDHEPINCGGWSSSDDDSPHAQEEAVYHAHMRWVDETQRCEV